MSEENSKTPTWQRLGYPSYRAWVLDYNKKYRSIVKEKERQIEIGAVLCAGYTAVEVAILHLVCAHVLYGDAQCDPDDHERRVRAQVHRRGR